LVPVRQGLKNTLCTISEHTAKLEPRALTNKPGNRSRRLGVDLSLV
jgi:hypothetical protein